MTYPSYFIPSTSTIQLFVGFISRVKCGATGGLLTVLFENYVHVLIAYD